MISHSSRRYLVTGMKPQVNRKLMRKTFMIAIFFLLVSVYYLLIPLYVDCKRPKYKKDNHTKLVLTFTTLWELPDWYLDLRKARINSNCPYKCEYIKDKRALYEADAVLFHGRSVDLLPVNALLLKPRAPALWDQIWIFKLNESPLSYPDAGLLSYENIFNWTMTYRRDSDIYAPNGEFMLKNHGRRPFEFKKLEIDDESLRSRKLIASMISNCNPNSQRLQYISLMKHYTTVDDYGACGTLTCDKKANYLDCYELFGKQYKFFLAFENSFCADYVTEKAFQPLRNGLVPIVRGGGNYSGIFPKGSYIDTEDFKSVLELVSYLNYLDRNYTEYRKYFEWRDFYDINSDQECEMCTKIHQFNFNKDRKSYANISSWYHTNYTQHHLCIDPQVPII